MASLSLVKIVTQVAKVTEPLRPANFLFKLVRAKIKKFEYSF